MTGRNVAQERADAIKARRDAERETAAQPGQTTELAPLADVVARALAEHRFTATRSVNGTPNFGWCAGGDSHRTKHISEHEAHVAERVAAALADQSYTPGQSCGGDRAASHD